MEKTISTRDFSAIKKMAQIVNPLVSKKATILKKVAALMEEVEGPTGLDVQINGMEAGIKAKFCGLGTEQLIKKVVIPYVREDGTPVLDAKTGKQLTKTLWEPTELLKYNEEKNNYTLTIPEGENIPEGEDAEHYAEEAAAQDAFAQQAAEEEADDNNPFGI